ncbi:MAG: ion transporter [Desulfurococcales archaeon]|nr:ion transporter [Desulfurococcales archaeon]
MGDRPRRALLDFYEHPVVEIVMAYVALVSVIVILAELFIPLDPVTKRNLYIVDAVAVLLLAGDFIHRARASGDPIGYARANFYEIPALIPAAALAMVETQLAGAGLVRLVRVFRVIRLFMFFSRGSRFLTLFKEVLRGVRFGEFGLVIVLTILTGSFAVYLVEAPNPDSPIKSMADAFWWAMATATTVGYGDIVPVTGLGRMIGVVMMILGISLLSVFISTIGAAFYEYTLTLIQGGRLEASIHDRIKSIHKLSEEEVEELIKDIRRLREERLSSR